MTNELREQRLKRYNEATERARAALKPGDRLRVTDCPGTKRWIVFAGWDGRQGLLSKSGRVYSPYTIDRVNGRPADFTRNA